MQGKFPNYTLEHSQRSPFKTVPVTMQTSQEAYASVLRNVGACVPKRNTVDARAGHETKTGTAKYEQLWGGGGKGIIDSQNDVGGGQC